MRGYWIRIAVVAALIFGVGMVIWTMVQRGKRAVRSVVESADPITLPLALIPFMVDGANLGTLREVQVVRKDAETVEAINFKVKLSDTIADDRLDNCLLVVGDALGRVDGKRIFRCVGVPETTGMTLAPVGAIETQRGRSYVLLAKAGILDSIDLDFNVDSLEAHADSLAARADSLEVNGAALADSIRASVESTLAETRVQVEAAKAAAREAKRAARARSAAEVAAPPAPR